MDVTPERGYPFPECDPPLTKDSSNIVQLRDLALAVDSDVQSVYNRAANVVVLPAAARMSMSAFIAGTDAGDWSPVFTSRTLDTTAGNAMTPLSEGCIRLVEPGWYSVGSYTDFISSTYLGARFYFTADGVQATSHCTQAEIGLSNYQTVHHCAEVVTRVPNVLLSIRYRIGASSPSYTYSARIWASRVADV